MRLVELVLAQGVDVVMIDVDVLVLGRDFFTTLTRSKADLVIASDARQGGYNNMGLCWRVLHAKHAGVDLVHTRGAAADGQLHRHRSRRHPSHPHRTHASRDTTIADAERNSQGECATAFQCLAQADLAGGVRSWVFRSGTTRPPA